MRTRLRKKMLPGALFVSPPRPQSTSLLVKSLLDCCSSVALSATQASARASRGLVTASGERSEALSTVSARVGTSEGIEESEESVEETRLTDTLDVLATADWIASVKASKSVGEDMIEQIVCR